MPLDDSRHQGAWRWRVQAEQSAGLLLHPSQRLHLRLVIKFREGARQILLPLDMQRRFELLVRLVEITSVDDVVGDHRTLQQHRYEPDRSLLLQNDIRDQDQTSVEVVAGERGDDYQV